VNKRIYSIDTMRVFAIFFIVTRHAHPFPKTAGIDHILEFFLFSLGRFVIPFFLMSSGFLFGIKIKQNGLTNYAPSYLKRIASMYFFGISVYFIFLTLAWTTLIEETAPLLTTLRNLAVHTLAQANLLYYGRYPAPILWYFPAVFYSLVLISLFVYFKKERYLMPISFLLYLVATLSRLYHIGFKIPIITKDALFFGFFYVTLGYFLAKNRKIVKPTKVRLYFGLFFFFALLQLAEAYLIVGELKDPGGWQGLVTVPLTIAFFMFVLAKPNLGKSTPLPKLGSYVIGVFLLHPLVIHSTKFLINWLNIGSIRNTIGWAVLYVPYIFFTSILVYMFLEKIGYVQLFFRYNKARE